MPQLQFRSIWMSDLHLGSNKLQAEQLLDFLLQTESEFLYLVGDIIDLILAKEKWHWPMINDQIMQAIIEKAHKGTKVFYIPGNHDHALRKFDGRSFNNIRLMNSAIHETADGSRYLVMHGDTLDPVIRFNARPARNGTAVHFLHRGVDRVVKTYHRIRGKEDRSLSAWLIEQINLSPYFLGSFEESVIREVVEHTVDGLICGHIHRAGIREIGNILYNNAGDWVESCTALAENHAGRLGIVEWRNQRPLQEAITPKSPITTFIGQLFALRTSRAANVPWPLRLRSLQAKPTGFDIDHGDWRAHRR